MKRKNLCVLCAGVGLGVILGACLTSWLLRGAAPATAAPVAEELLTVSEAISPAQEPETDAEPLSQTATQMARRSDGAAYGEWDKSTIYNGGDKVLYQGKLYRAKWWTQGEKPGQADVWEDTKETPAPTTPPKPVASPEMSTAKSEDFKVVGYYPSWRPGATDMLRNDVLTHVIYAFAIPTAEGGLRPLDNEDTAKAIIKESHEHGVKVLIAIGGWSYNDTPLESTFVSATATAKKRAAFADAIVALCDRLGFDGVDMDWEHPRVDGKSGKQYEELMMLLAKKLHAEDKLLTSAVLGGVTADGNIFYDAAAHSDKVLGAVDWINVMAYDGGDGERHSPYDFAVNCGTYWRKTRGLAADKVVLGVPFYARPSWASYGEILDAVPSAWKSDQVQFNGMTACYNGVATMQKKTNYALDNLGGIMIWEITQDTADTKHSLLTAIGKTVAERKAKT